MWSSWFFASLRWKVGRAETPTGGRWRSPRAHAATSAPPSEGGGVDLPPLLCGSWSFRTLFTSSANSASLTLSAGRPGVCCSSIDPALPRRLRLFDPRSVGAGRGSFLCRGLPGFHAGRDLESGDGRRLRVRWKGFAPRLHWATGLHPFLKKIEPIHGAACLLVGPALDARRTDLFPIPFLQERRRNGEHFCRSSASDDLREDHRDRRRVLFRHIASPVADRVWLARNRSAQH